MIRNSLPAVLQQVFEYHVNESLLKQVATTDPGGHNHYRFISDAHSLKLHYRELATSLVCKGNS